MKKWIEVVQCNGCKKIYPGITPNVCGKCAARLAKRDELAAIVWGKDARVLVNAKRIVARKRLFGWEVKEGKQ